MAGRQQPVAHESKRPELSWLRRGDRGPVTFFGSNALLENAQEP
jgi:hypothetical protein